MTKPKENHCAPEMLLETVDGDKEIFLELAEIFLRESSTKFSELRSAAAAGDLVICGRHSHSLKGTVGPLGAEALVQMLQNLEDECQQKQCNCDAARISTIDDELNQVKAEVQQFIAQF